MNTKASKLSLTPAQERYMACFPLLVVLAMLFYSVPQVSPNQTINIGFIYSSSTNMSPLMAAGDMAVEHLNMDPSFFSLQSRGYQFKLVAARSDCSNGDGLYQLVKLATRNNNNNTRESLDAVIGKESLTVAYVE